MERAGPHPAPAEHVPAWQGGLALLALCLAGWLTYLHFPISLYCLGAGLLALALYGVEIDPSPARSRSLKQRIVEILARDSRRVALLLCIGLGMVWLAQIALNLVRSAVDPAQMFAFEYRLYEVAAWLDLRLSASTLLIGLVVAMLLSFLLSAFWPIRVLGALRQTIGAAVVILAAITGFTFVTVERASARHELLAGPIRARIAGNLDRLAEARQEHAAWQWLTADVRGDREKAPDSAEAWREYFRAAARACDREDRRFGSRYAELAARQPEPPPIPEASGSLVWPSRISLVARPTEAAPARRSVTVPDYCDPADYVPQLAEVRKQPPGAGFTPPGRHWLSDIGPDLGPPPVQPETGPVQDPTVELVLTKRIIRFAELNALDRRTERRTLEAERARDAARAVAVDALASLMPPEWEGIAKVVADSWKGSFIEALAGETAARIQERVGALRFSMDGHVGPAMIALLLATRSPIESPATAARRLGSIERVVRNDAIRAGRPEPEAAAARQVARRATLLSRIRELRTDAVRPPPTTGYQPPTYRPPPYKPYEPSYRPQRPPIRGR